MISPEPAGDRGDSSWLEALHDAIVTDTEVEFVPTLGGSAPEDFETLRDCLWLLDQFRRQREPAAPLPDGSAGSKLSVR